jgi:hypothetical protein
MGVLLVILAGVICLLYTGYFVRIIKNDAEDFEAELIKALAEWIIATGVVSKGYIWSMFVLSLLVELIYFWLTLKLISNPFMIYLTVMFIAVEILHISRIAVGLNHFFTGKALLSGIFNWRVERASAILFYTHTLLVLAILIFL